MNNRIDRHSIVNNEKVLFHHLGEVTKDVVLDAVSDLENLLDSFDVSKLLKKRTVYIAIECLQNLQLHGRAAGQKLILPPEFFLTKSHDSFNISIGNVVKKEASQMLSDKLTKINSLNEEELKYLFSVVMKHSGVTISTKTGAGLGLIDMRKKSTRELQFKFQEVDDEHIFFNMKVSLPDNL